MSMNYSPLSRLLLPSLLWLAFLLQASFCSPIFEPSYIPPVKLHIEENNIVIDNGIVQITLSTPSGFVIGVYYNGVDVLEPSALDNARGYWDVVWKKPGKRGSFDKLQTTNFSVIFQNEEQVEVSFTRTWNHSVSTIPLNIDKRFIVRRGSSGFYAYAILERLEGWPAVNVDQIRMVFRPRTDKFQYMAISENKQRMMPTGKDRETGKPLAYPEAVRLTNPANPQFRGEVDDKYAYSLENREINVHGWISPNPRVGIWVITPSHEFLAGGPLKQDLTLHAGPVLLSMFTSNHYRGKNLDAHYEKGKSWKKVFGPIFVYLNSASPEKDQDYRQLWCDAKTQMLNEVKSWPYSFVQSEDFPGTDERGTVSGQLQIQEPYISKSLKVASFAWVGLAAPGKTDSWQFQTKGYQFWTQADKNGNFLIRNIRPGNYSLYAWVPGIIGSYKAPKVITVKPGMNVSLGAWTYIPPRNGPTLWEIGTPDRSAAEFFVPAANPKLSNKLYINSTTDKYRQYGLWERYTELYPHEDLKFTVGISNYTQDWFFAQVTRNVAKEKYRPTTWQIVFQLKNVTKVGNYTLQLALASASRARLQGRFNNRKAARPHFSTGSIGSDNAIARHGIHGVYRLFSTQVPSRLLHQGSNTLFLTQANAKTAFQGIMYDYIRLEGPPPTMGYIGS